MTITHLQKTVSNVLCFAKHVILTKTVWNVSKTQKFNKVKGYVYASLVINNLWMNVKNATLMKTNAYLNVPKTQKSMKNNKDAKL